MDNLDSVLTAFTIAAGAALGVERSLEFLKVIVDRGYGVVSDQSAKILLDRAERLNSDVEAVLSSTLPEPPRKIEEEQSSPDTLSLDLKEKETSEEDAELSERFEPPQIPVAQATAYSIADSGKNLFFLVTGAALGILFAQFLGLRFLSLFLDPQTNVYIGFVDILFTGVVIGGGSQPIHALIRFVGERRINTVPTRKAEKVEIEQTPLLNASGKSLRRAILANTLVESAQEVLPGSSPINYYGGLDIDKLETRHIRKAPIDLIVYHHTAASSNASFEHIVNELTVKKGWLTGYHCIVMPDGSLNFMCRWDRYGTHAKSRNLNSLGLAFQGNFHSAPGDRFSNADGRFGNQKPTDAQLNSAAKLIALWVHLYRGIALDFDRNILPHRDAKPGHTVCPGSNFPHQELAKKVRQHYRLWREDANAAAQLEIFKNDTPYVYSEAEKI